VRSNGLSVEEALIGVKPKAVPAFKKLLELIRTKEPSIDIYEAFRSQERQDALYTQGRESYERVVRAFQKANLPPPSKSEAANVVTWTKTSNHTKGLAVDLVPTKNGAWFWPKLDHIFSSGRSLRSIYEETATQAEAFGIIWPLGVKDLWHFEFQETKKPLIDAEVYGSAHDARSNRSLAAIVGSSSLVSLALLLLALTRSQM